MKEEKSFWEKLKRWIDGDEVLLDADEIISKKRKKSLFMKKEFSDWRHSLQCNPVLCAFRFRYGGIHCSYAACSYGAADVWRPEQHHQQRGCGALLGKGIAETGAINFVAGMILDYRAFDTFGESNVLFMAVIAVLMLLQRDKKNIDYKKIRCR